MVIFTHVGDFLGGDKCFAQARQIRMIVSRMLDEFYFSWDLSSVSKSRFFEHVTYLSGTMYTDRRAGPVRRDSHTWSDSRVLVGSLLSDVRN